MPFFIQSKIGNGCQILWDSFFDRLNISQPVTSHVADIALKIEILVALELDLPTNLLGDVASGTYSFLSRQSVSVLTGVYAEISVGSEVSVLPSQPLDEEERSVTFSPSQAFFAYGGEPTASIRICQRRWAPMNPFVGSTLIGEMYLPLDGLEDADRTRVIRWPLSRDGTSTGVVAVKYEIQARSLPRQLSVHGPWSLIFSNLSQALCLRNFCDFNDKAPPCSPRSPRGRPQMPAGEFNIRAACVVSAVLRYLTYEDACRFSAVCVAIFMGAMPVVFLADDADCEPVLDEPHNSKCYFDRDFPSELMITPSASEVMTPPVADVVDPSCNFVNFRSMCVAPSAMRSLTLAVDEVAMRQLGGCCKIAFRALFGARARLGLRRLTTNFRQVCSSPTMVNLILSCLSAWGTGQFVLTSACQFRSLWSTAFLAGGIIDVAGQGTHARREFEHLAQAHPLLEKVLRLHSNSNFVKPSCHVLAMSDCLLLIGFAAGAAAVQQLSVVSRATAKYLGGVLPVLSSAHGCIYTCGKFSDTQDFTDQADQAACLSLQTKEWQQLPPMSVPRSGCAVASVGGCLYTLGGHCFETSDTGHAERFNPVTNQWQTIPPMPVACSHAVAVAAGGRIFVFGGLSRGQSLRQILCFDPTLWKWIDVDPQIMKIGRFECAAALHQGRIFIVGGSNSKGRPLEAVECYNTKHQVLDDVPPLNFARYGCAAVSGKTFVLVLGGRSLGSTLISEVECFDDETGVWSIATLMPIPRMRCGAIAVDEDILVFGGRGADDETLVTVNDFNLAARRWGVDSICAWSQPMTSCVAVAALS